MNVTLDRDGVLAAMRSLGYQTHTQNGEITQQAWNTALELRGVVVEHPLVAQQIAMVWAKHGPAPLSEVRACL